MVPQRSGYVYFNFFAHLTFGVPRMDENILAVKISDLG